MGEDRKHLEVVFLLIGGVGVPVIASLFLPALPKSLRVPVGIGVGALVIVAGVMLLVRHLRHEIKDAAQQVLMSLEGYDTDLEAGTLLKGNISNVSLRIATLHDLMDSILQAVPEERRDEVLHRAGQAAGASWGADFEAECRRAKMDMSDLAEKLDLWSSYDASAGMGKMDLDISSDAFGKVVLTNSFLSEKPACHPLNHWFAGYLAGTLRHVLDRRVMVTLEKPSLERQRTTHFTVEPTAP